MSNRKSKIIGLLLALSLGGGAAATLLPAPAAEAAVPVPHAKKHGGTADDSATDPHNCHGKIQRRGLGFGPSRSGLIVTPWLTSYKTGHMWVFTTLVGNYCPNGTHPNKFYPTKLSHCYTWDMDNGASPPYGWFTGQRVNSYIFERKGGRNVNPPRYVIKDDKSRQNCSTQYLSDGVSAWIRTGGDHHPRMTQYDVTQLKNPMPDEGWQHDHEPTGNEYVDIKPSEMSKLGKWRNP